MRNEVDKVIEEMKSQGVIEESQSPWVSPVVLVRKKDGTIRFCVDFRKLNMVTIKDSYPLPRIDEILDQLAGNSWFSTLDLKSGYWQLKLRPEDKEKTAFSFGRGLWQFTVMPFGLCNAPATFERLMERVLRNLLSKICLVYLDDIIIYGKSFTEMMENLEKVLLRLREANLKINPTKCILFSRKVKYLGHVISAEGVATDPEKIVAVREWPTPHTKKQLRSFLGFCSYYRKFVKDFSSLAKPLYALTENRMKFEWGKECQNAFEQLKFILSSSPILSFPKGEDEFILDTDASNIGIGAVLSQKQEGEEKVIAYFSRVLSKAERNYCVTRRELLAIVNSVKSFRHYLLGRRFVIRTDHVSLRWLMSFRDLEGQLARWLERLQQYDFEIIHRKGLSHKNTDGLSRRLGESFGCEYCAKVEKKYAEEFEKTVARIMLEGENLEEWRKAQEEDSLISIILQGKKAGVRPSRSEIAAKDVSAQLYWSY
ncbi:Retrovirus-related Pol polyprotein from transposon 17.6 [Formica fusca]